jgi:tetratricopeptide (TPR) repeat protein
MRIPQERRLFGDDRPRENPYRLLLWGALIVAGLSVARGVSSGEIEPLFAPTPTSTRTANSYREEGEAFFSAGNLNRAVTAYEDAIRVDPGNAQVLAELARIQTYSSALLSGSDGQARLASARENIQQAVELAPDSSYVHAIRALVLDWSGTSIGLSQEERQGYLVDAEQAAIRAGQLDAQNVLALAFLAEVLSDQLRWDQARPLAEQAVAADGNSMDAHRVLAGVYEALGLYNGAIEEYQAAAEIAPNLTFLYISIGQNFRQLQLYDQALEYFDRAASINEVLGINDPLPYVAIAKTYTRQGEFFIALRNAERALDFDPANAELYGELGLIYFRNRNYESSIPVLRCAVSGCTGLEDGDEDVLRDVPVDGLPLNDSTVIFYYTFGSVLAALDQCEEALPVLNQVASAYSEEQLIIDIVSDGLAICGASLN